MKRIYTTNSGEQEVDPYDSKGRFLIWLEKISSNNGYNLKSFSRISENSSILLTQHLLDLYQGKNLSKGTKKGKRSYNHLNNIKTRLNYLIEILEKKYNKLLIELNEDEILNTFQNMRDGIILNKNNTPHLCVSSYAKAFSAFYRYIIRIKRKENIIIPNVVEALDTSVDRKPKWHYFTLQDVEKMAIYSKSFYYKALIYFLFDSGIRAPRELMNVRVKDITINPGTNNLFLTIRDETSKTFGRKIKLMICSDIIKKYIEVENLKPEDFLFTKDYTHTTRTVSRIGFDALKVGKENVQKTKKVLIKNGITMYDFRHNSVCHYLPIYKSENQMKYRYGWKKSEMIHYYSEFIGMRDTINEEDMLIDGTKTQLEQELQKEKMKLALMEEKFEAKQNQMKERFEAQQKQMEDKMKEMERMMLQRFADTYEISIEK